MRPQLFKPVAGDVGADFLPRFVLPKPRDHRLDTAGLHPWRQNVLQRVRARGIRIGIAIDVDAARLGVGDHGQRLRGLAPIVHAGAFEMHDLDMHAALLADRYCLRDRLDHFVGLVAQMGEIAGIVPLEHMAERDHLGGLRVGAGRREQARRHAERAGIERVFQQRDHLRELGRARRALRHAHHHQAQRVVADQHAGIHRSRRKRLQIIREARFAKRQPWRARARDNP